MSIEQELMAVLKAYKTSVTVYPFSVPDSDTNKEAIAFKRIGNRVSTRYHSMDKQIDKSLFFVTRVCNSFLELTDGDQRFVSYLTKYIGRNIINISIDTFDDYQDPQGFFERQYQIVILLSLIHI